MADFKGEGSKEEKKLIPFLKFGPFDPENYPPKEAKRLAQTEKEFGTLRALEGEEIYGEVTGFYDTPKGEVMYLKNVRLSGKDTGSVKIPVSKAMKSLLTEENITKGSEVLITYKGKVKSNSTEYMYNDFSVKAVPPF